MFDINQHIAKISNDSIEAIIKPTFYFFEKSPFHQLDNLPSFEGAGVYAIFFKSTTSTCYEGHLPPMHPIYVGKAVPSGSRQGRGNSVGKPLRSRLMKHLNSIKQAENLNEGEFLCRFMIIEDLATDMISAIESYLIKQYSPLWNSYIDGFGINAPGAGRYNQQPSEWDTIHPGRGYAKLLTGATRDKSIILQKIVNYKNIFRSE